MSSVDNRIVSMTFDNERFERNLAATLDSLDKLTESLNLVGAANGFDDLSRAAAQFDTSPMISAIEDVGNKFSALGAIAFTIIQDLTRATLDFARNLGGNIFEPLFGGGKRRAENIEQAMFMFRGLNMDIESAMKSALDAVRGTAYGLDVAAKAAAQLGGSGLKAGEEMTGALRGIAGVAAMTNTSFEEMADVFTAAAGKGKVSGYELQRIGQRGVNAAAKLAEIWGTTEAEVRRMASEGEISFKKFAQGMDQAFGEHAQKANETYSGSLANMRAALSRLGASFFGPNMIQQRDLFNSLTPAIDKAHDALKPFIARIVELKGIGVTNLIEAINKLDFTNFTLAVPNFAEGIKSVFIGVQQFLRVIKEAFRDVFPPSTTSMLLSFSEAFKNITEKFKMGEGTIAKLRDVFRGFFSVIDIGKTIIKEFLKFIGNLFGSSVNFSSLGSKILDFAQKVGIMLQVFNNMLVGEGGIHKFFIRLEEVIRAPLKAISNFKDAIVNMFSDGAPGAEAVSNALGRVESRFDSLTTISERFKNFWKNLGKVLGEVWHHISTWFSELGSNLAAVLEPGDFNAVVDIVNVGLLGGIALILEKFISGGFKNFGIGFLDKLGEVLDGLTGHLKAMQANVKADTLMKIAIAVGILTASVLVLSTIDSVALTAALVAMSVGFAQMIGVMALLNGVTATPMAAVKVSILTAGLILLAGAMVVLSVAIKILSTLSWAELAKGLIGIAGGLGVMVAAMHLLPPSPGLIASGIAMTAIAIALIILSKAIKSFSTMSFEEIATGIIGVAGGLGIVAAAMWLMPPHMAANGAGLIIVATALLILSKAVKSFSQFSWGEMAKGLIGVGSALVVISAAMWLMPPNMIVTAAALVILSTALTVMARAVKFMGKMDIDELAKGIGALGLMLLVVAGAMTVMTGTIAGAAALVVVSGALLILVRVLKTLGNMKISEIVTGLAALAGVFVVIGLAGLVLGPIIPMLLGLGGALILIGGAMTLFGVGAYLVAKAFQAMAKAGKVGVAVLIESIKMFITAMPEFVGAIVKAVAELAEELLTAGSVLLKFITVFLIQILDTIIELVPEIAEALSTFITHALILIREKFPDILHTGFLLLMELLRGVRDNIGQITVLGIDIVTNLATALANNASKIIESAIFLLLSFLTAITDRIGEIVSAGVNILVNLLLGISQNISKVVDTVALIITTFVTEIFNKSGEIVTAGVNALVDFVKGIGKDIDTVITAGKDVVLKFMEGLATNTVEFADAAANILINFLNALAIVIEEKIPELVEAGKNIARAIGSGVADGVESIPVIGPVAGLAGDIIGAFSDPLGLRSPSRVFRKLAENVIKGFVIGINNDNSAKNSVVSQAESIVSAFQKSLSKVPDSIAGMDELNPVITPVLDLTKVQRASRDLNRFMSVSTIAPEVSYAQANLISKTTDLESKVDVERPYSGPAEVRFEQNIFSPTALSTNDIYRSTKSQIVLAKEELGIS